MKATIGSNWTVDIKPGATEYRRDVKVTCINDTHAITENLSTGRRSRIRLAPDGSLAGYKPLEPAPR